MSGYFTNKKVLIIGGTGTIGQSLLRSILPEKPAVIRVLSRDEHKQFQLQHMLKEHNNIRYLIGDVRDQERVQRAMQDIDYVFHCAAMKHVPSCEYNPFEAVQTNVMGTQNVISAALSMGVRKVVLTSTDKAISPTNTYGASKLMAERLISASQNQTGPKDTVFAAVRFGNVMGSRGSVIPLFDWQIKNNNEITVTDINMSRFMMTLSQATNLTIEAMKQSNGGEVFVLKMPVLRLADLAEVMIEERSNQEYTHKKVQIREIGLRPGEKMYEELMTEEEADKALELPGMFVIPNNFYKKEFEYPGAVRAEKQSYNSHMIEPITKSEVKRMVMECFVEHENRMNSGELA